MTDLDAELIWAIDNISRDMETKHMDESKLLIAATIQSIYGDDNNMKK